MPRKKPGYQLSLQNTYISNRSSRKGAAASKKATPIKTAPDTSPLALATIYQPRVHDWSYSQVQGNAVPRNFAVTSYPTVRTFVDPPGNLSPNGPRHDNDKASIEEIAILPTTSEIQANRAEYLPPKGNGFPHHESGIHRLLDSQFRLLREDTAGQLRDAVRGLVEHWEVLVCGNDLNAKRKCVQQIGCEMKILDWVKVVRVRGKRMIIDVSFAQPDIVSRMTQYQRMNWWSDSRDLETGNLVALVDDVLGTTFLLVKDRVVVKPMGESQGQDYDFPSWGFDREADSLAGDADRAMLSFTLATPTSVIDKERIIALSRQTTFGTAVLVQFPGILYAAFEPFLNRLKSLHKQPNLPFQKWIVPTAGTNYATKNGFIEVPPSPYLRLVDLDLSCITTNRYPLIFSTNNPVTVKQLMYHTALDRGQCESFIMSLMHELALIQGPPGTGKSYVGYKLVQVLLDNRDRLNLGPIICVWFVYQPIR